VKLAIMQPYFFPYLGHFALIAAVDEWIVFDISQYTRKSWISRNRVLRPEGGWQYISMPLENSSIHISISQARIANPGDQERYVLGKISHYAKRAPYYPEVCQIVRNTFAHPADGSLASLNIRGLQMVCRYLRLPFHYRVCSQLALEFPHKLAAGGWAPWIAAKLAADVYINPIGGRALFDPAGFSSEGTDLRFLDFKRFVYATPGYSFENDLSILDVLMWNSPEVVARTIRENSALISALS